MEENHEPDGSCAHELLDGEVQEEVRVVAGEVGRRDRGRGRCLRRRHHLHLGSGKVAQAI